MEEKNERRNKRWLFPALAVVLVLLLVVFQLGAQESRSNAASGEMDFETALKLAVYKEIDREMGAYLEDRNAEYAAEWTVNKIRAVTERYGIETGRELDDIREALLEGFDRLLGQKLVTTNGMGDCTEISRAYIANMAAESFFTVCQELAEKTVETEYLTSDIDRLQEIRRITEITERLEEYFAEYYKEYCGENFADKSYVQDEISAFRKELDAMQTILADMRVTETYVTREEWEAQTAAQLNSVAVLSERLGELWKLTGQIALSVEELSELTGQIAISVDELSELISQIAVSVEKLREEVQNSFAENDAKIQNLEEQFGIRLTELDTTVNGQIAKNYETLLQMIAAGDGEIEKLKQADMGIHSQLCLLGSQISSSNSELRLAILEVNDRLNDYMIQTDTEIAGIKVRLDHLEERFNSSSGTVTQLLGTLLTKADALDTSGLRTQIADNTGLIGGKLTELNGLLQTLQESLGETSEELSLQESIAGILTRLAETRLALQEYGRNLTARIDSLDTSLITAKTSLADMSAETQQQFVSAAAELVGIQNAEAAYFARIQEQIVALTNEVWDMLSQAKQISDRIYVDQQIASGSAIILEMMEEQRQEIDGEITGLEDRFTGLLGDLEGRFEEMTDRFEETAEAVTEILNMLLTRAGELDTSGIRKKTTENAEVLGNRLLELDRELDELQASLGDSAEEQAVSGRAEAAKAEITEIQKRLAEYLTDILAQLDGMDDGLLNARISLGKMDSETRQKFVAVSEKLLYVQNRAQVCDRELRERVGMLTDRIQDVLTAAAETSDMIYIDAVIRNSVEEMKLLVAEQGNQLEVEMSALDSRFTEFLETLRENLEKVDQNMNDRLEQLENRMVVTRLEGFTITLSDWQWDGASGRYYYEIQSGALKETSHVDIQYAGDPGIEPVYSGTAGLMRISVKYPAEVRINNIFIYN